MKDESFFLEFRDAGSQGCRGSVQCSMSMFLVKKNEIFFVFLKNMYLYNLN